MTIITIEEIEKKIKDLDIPVTRETYHLIAERILPDPPDRVEKVGASHGAIQMLFREEGDAILDEIESMPEYVEYRKAENIVKNGWSDIVIFRVCCIQKDEAVYNWLKDNGHIQEVRLPK
jgi:hypothetical protein